MEEQFAEKCAAAASGGGELQKGAVSDLSEVERKAEDSEVCAGNWEGTPVALGPESS